MQLPYVTMHFFILAYNYYKHTNIMSIWNNDDLIVLQNASILAMWMPFKVISNSKITGLVLFLWYKNVMFPPCNVMFQIFKRHFNKLYVHKSDFGDNNNGIKVDLHHTLNMSAQLPSAFFHTCFICNSFLWKWYSQD